MVTVGPDLEFVFITEGPSLYGTFKCMKHISLSVRNLTL